MRRFYHEVSPRRVFDRQTIAAAALLIASCCVHAQSDDADTSGAQLQQLIDGEKSAVDSGDQAQIQAQGRKSGALSLRLLGTLYTGAGQCSSASDALRDSLTAEEVAADPQQRFQTGLLLLHAELCATRPKAADATAAELLTIAGDTPQVHLLIANVYHGSDDLTGTIGQLNQALKLDPQFAPAHQALGKAYWELNEYQYNPDTLREFTAAQALTPDDYFANESLGSVLSQYERYQEAATYLNKAAALDPASPDPWLQLGMNAFSIGDRSAALEALQKAVSLTGADEQRNGYQIRRAYPALTRLEVSAGNLTKAQEYEKREESTRAAMLRADISTPLTESTGLIASHASRDPKAAEHQVSSVLTKDQQEVAQRLQAIAASSLNDAGTALARERRYDEALPLFRIAAVADPGLQPVMRNLGLAAFHAGAYTEAVSALTRALQQNPDDALVRDDLEESQALAGKQ